MSQGTTIILWVPLVLMLIVETVFSGRCFWACISFLRLSCPWRRRKKIINARRVSDLASHSHINDKVTLYSHLNVLIIVYILIKVTHIHTYHAYVIQCLKHTYVIHILVSSVLTHLFLGVCFCQIEVLFCGSSYGFYWAKCK